jgi:DNA repair protein RecO (recombination protein O)
MASKPSRAKIQRVTDEPAFVLHHYDWSESSLILDVFTRHHGRLALVAKGAKKPSSQFRPVLLPLQPWSLSYSLSPDENAEIHTLKGAEWVGGHIMPTGDALLSGYYLNELLMRLVAREDAHPALFDAYAGAVRVLASEHGEALQPLLRAFEWVLLFEAGLLPALDHETVNLAPLHADRLYVLTPEAGLRAAGEPDRGGLPGRWWQQLHAVFHGLAPDPSAEASVTTPPVLPLLSRVLSASAEVASELKLQLRGLVHYHCGGRTLRTRQLMMDLQNL